MLELVLCLGLGLLLGMSDGDGKDVSLYLPWLGFVLRLCAVSRYSLRKKCHMTQQFLFLEFT